MSTLFTKIIDGEIPARFVWRDERCVGFLSINPLGPGHTLVVPREEVDHWVDAAPDLLAHLTDVSQTVAKAVHAVFAPPRVGFIIAGYEIPHLHLHVYPTWSIADFSFARAATEIDAAEQDGYAERLRAALREAGHGAHVPA
jgi:diadenosine tetraphosphate (Ap4A) HIT family hydrolase